MACGVAGGLLACALLGGAEASTLYALAKFAERHRARTYGDLVRKTLGTCAADGLSLLLVCYLFGSCTAYLVIAADCFIICGPDCVISNEKRTSCR